MSASIAVSDNQLDRSITESVDEGLLALLGANVRRTIYTFWERRFSIPRDQIPAKIDDFNVAFGSTFGSSTPTVCRFIVKRLYSKLGLEFTEKSNYRFAEYVKEARMKR